MGSELCDPAEQEVGEIADVFVFETEEKCGDEIKVRAGIVKDLFRSYDDISSAACIAEYYRRLFLRDDDMIEENRITNPKYSDGLSMIGPQNIPFRTYAEHFSFIKDASVGIVVNHCDEAAALCEALKAGVYSVRRKLQRYTVSLKMYEFEEARKLGIVDDFGTGVFMLTNPEYYSAEIGLALDKTNDIILV